MEVQNLTVTVDLCCPFNLELLFTQIENSKLNQCKLHSLIWRFMQPKSCILLYENGKAVCVGAKTLVQAVNVIKEALSVLEKLGYKPRSTKLRISNYVGSYSIGHPVDLEKFYNSFRKHSAYEPELFPALTYKTSKATVLLFRKGKTIITGAKTIHDLEESFQEILILLRLS